MKHSDTTLLREKTQHGDALFPFQHYDTSFHALVPELTIHWHPEMEFTKITAGSAIYSVNLQEFNVSEGDFLFISPGLLHAARIYPRGSMSSETFVFHADLLGNSSADICTLRYFSPLADGTLNLSPLISREHSFYQKTSQIFDRLCEVSHEKAFGYELKVKALLFTLLHGLLTHETSRPADQPAAYSQRLKLIFDYIHAHYAEDISVEKLAQLCCISPSHFMHFFKEKSGTSFSQYLTQYRLRQSALFLRQNMEIADAAFSCGFNNLPYYYKRFREYYHMTPREFQKASVGSLPTS
ncbi:AraC family transcriptional regulator [Roseburia hominis]